MSEQAMHVRMTYTVAPSNKEYQIDLRKNGKGWIVDFAYGRIGNTLQTGTKTPTPLPYEQALIVYNKLIESKMNGSGDRYTLDDNGESSFEDSPAKGRGICNPSFQAVTAKVDTGLRPQLLTPIDEARAHELMRDQVWCMQEKLDGNRVLIHVQVSKRKTEVLGANRKGQRINLPVGVEEAATGLVAWEPVVIDGELIGERFVAFDVLELHGKPVGRKPYGERWLLLEEMLLEAATEIHLVACAYHTDSKEKLMRELRRRNAEGAVFKLMTARYSAGARNDDQLKFKFWETLSCVVMEQNEQRSVEVGMFNGGALQKWGSVTIPPNKAVPDVGDVIEVKYLYAVESLVQAIYLGKRTDIDVEDCRVEQIKFKAGNERAK